RLSEDPTARVAIIEAGGAGDSWLVNAPAATVLMVPRKINNWAFETVPQAGLNGRVGYQPRGKALGGSSAINAMVYIRGHRSDYDYWAALGNRGWSYEEVLPYFKKSENNYSFANPFHGNNGPLPVNKLRSDNPFQMLFLEAGRQAGYKLTDDFNGIDQEGVGVYQVTQKDGERWSAARAYITPFLGKRDNLRVELNATIQRIVFEGKRAVGVEVMQDGTLRTLRARKEIILSCGAFQSPHILMLSGIGDGETLQRIGIPVRQHLPGVGRNLQDHPDFIFGYKSNSLDLLGLSAAGSVRLVKEILRYRNERRGMITSNFAECGAFLKTQPELSAPDIQLHFVTALVQDHARKL
ncbi:MAG TPA: GMC family oxidoreductase N-terminal domain-containing protein, partial [Pseudomonadales bacterium]|nr:GMC family oxidoreductase N-terminal domain-containing protein [Pseudomonadales bacterium]